MTEQLPEDSVQVVELKLPDPLELKVIVPVGDDLVPTLVSDTVTAQVVGALATIGLGVQPIDVAVDLVVADNVAVFELLV